LAENTAKSDSAVPFQHDLRYGLRYGFWFDLRYGRFGNVSRL